MENVRPELDAAYLKREAAEYFKNDPFFILGVSGGPDSMALMYLFHLAGLNALTVHINYQKRSEESDLDQELSEQMAFAWNFECVSVRLDPEEAAGYNFQKWARDQRYDIFGALKKEYQADAIVTAHHKDDQVETILQKLFRGSSPATWQGMKKWDGNIYRPLLSFSKEEILNFCETESVPYRTDASNLETDFARNFIRHEFSEKLDSFFPGWRQNVMGLQAYGRLFENSVRFITDMIFTGDRISLQAYEKLTLDLRMAVFKEIMDRSDENVAYSKGQLKQLTQLDRMHTGSAIEIKPFIFTRGREEIIIQIHDMDDPVDEIQISKENAADGITIKGITFQLHDTFETGELNLNTSHFQWPVCLRRWRKGDNFQPLGMQGHQNISDHLTNRKIAAHVKEKTLVLCGSDGTIYAIIYPGQAINNEKGAITEMAKCDDTTTTILTLTIE